MSETNESPTEETNASEQLGENGIKALKAERERADKAEKSLRAFTEIGLGVDELKKIVEERAKADPEAAIAKAKREAEQEAQGRLHDALRRLSVREAAMKAGFHDPELAVVLIGDALADVRVGADDVVDTAAVETALAKVVEQRPYLVKTSEPARPGDAGIGASGGALPLNGDGIELALRNALRVS